MYFIKTDTIIFFFTNSCVLLYFFFSTNYCKYSTRFLKTSGWGKESYLLTYLLRKLTLISCAWVWHQSVIICRLSASFCWIEIQQDFHNDVKSATWNFPWRKILGFYWVQFSLYAYIQLQLHVALGHAKHWLHRQFKRNSGSLRDTNRLLLVLLCCKMLLLHSSLTLVLSWL